MQGGLWTGGVRRTRAYRVLWACGAGPVLVLCLQHACSVVRQEDVYSKCMWYYGYRLKGTASWDERGAVHLSDDGISNKVVECGTGCVRHSSHATVQYVL